jgi:tRNA-splicing ligase RtcB
MSDPLTAGIVRQWLTQPLSADVRRAIERLCRCEDVWHVAIMPDVHLAEQVCVGVAVATTHLLYPDAVGGDIGCGTSAIGFDGSANVLADRTSAQRLMDGLRDAIAVNHRATAALVAPPPVLQDRPLSSEALAKLALRDGRVQLGTLGRGNHFLEFQADEEDRLWLMVHSGSRAMGQAIRSAHRPASVPPGQLPCIEADSPAGIGYLNDVAWAVVYAAASRRALVHAAGEVVRRLFGLDCRAETFLDCCHNLVRRERHLDRDCWVHRKGAIPAAVGDAGIIPGSMGSASFHVQGRGCEMALASSSHGAGRIMSRGEARARISLRALHKQLTGIWFDASAAPRLRDEAPGAYRDIAAVMRAQHDLTCVVRKLRPVLCYKGV